MVCSSHHIIHTILISASLCAYAYPTLQGSHLAKLALAYRSRYGIDGVPIDMTAAYGYYDEVAAQSIEDFHRPAAGVHLAESIDLQDSSSVDQNAGDGGEFVTYTRYAAERGDVHAQLKMAWAHYWGENGLERDYAQAARYYEMAKDAGHVDGQYNLGLMYKNGQGVDKNNATMLALLLLAARQNHSAALNAIVRHR